MLNNLNNYFVVEFKDNFIPDWIVDFSQIVVAITACIAICQFLYTKKRDRVISSVNEINFFRTQIMPAYEDFVDKIKTSQNNPSFIFPKITNISNFDVESIKSQGDDVVLAQFNPIKESVLKDNRLERVYLDVFNKLEEFSLRVLYLKISKHESMNCVIDAYITMVESTISYLITIRVGAGKNSFTGIERLYHLWKLKADRRSTEERLKSIKAVVTK